MVLVSLALSMTATGYVSALAQRAYGGNMAAMGALTGKVEELYAGNRVVKVFNRQAAMLEEAEVLNEAQFRAQRRAQCAGYLRGGRPAGRLAHVFGAQSQARGL